MPVWWKDGRGFTFEYNQRGHQVYKVVEVDAQTGKTRSLIDEQTKTFSITMTRPGALSRQKLPA